MNTPETFESWALIELFGHNKLVGKCTEQNVAGTNFLRVDVPATKGNPAFTRLLNHAAIYAINPITEDIAVHLAEKLEAKPIEAWDVRVYQEKQKALLMGGQVEKSEEIESPLEEEEEEEDDGIPYLR